MNKKIITLVIIIILAITAVAFWGILKSENKQPSSAENSPVPDSSKNNTTESEIDSNDPDIKGIESDLNSIDDDDFSADKLSDQNVGL